MLDIRFVRENPDAVRKAIREKRGELNLDALLEADARALELTRELQSLQERKNEVAKKIPAAGKDERPALIEQGRAIGDSISALKPRQEEAERALRALLLLTPAIPAEDAPRGLSEEENVEIRRWGEPPKHAFPAKDHIEILKAHRWAELERIALVSGTRSYALCGDAMLLEQSLLRFALDRLASAGLRLISVPALVGESALVGTGHFPTGREQAYHLPSDDKYLAGTSEVSLNSLHSGEILEEVDLPLAYAGFSACFRREAGTAGKDVRGLMRVHQFWKVEQYVLCAADFAESDRWHQRILSHSEEILRALELCYRVVEVCTGDMGAGKYRMHDIESWVPSERRFRETHSCSSLHDWQARRANLRYRGKDGKVRFCFTLNNTAIATPRVLIPFLETHQQADGRVRVPPALRPYLGGRDVIPS